MKTLSCNGHRELAGVRYHHGDELPPNILNEELADYWLDHRLAIEHDDTERRSLYRLLLHSPERCKRSQSNSMRS